MGYFVEVGGKRIYHAGDTDDIPEMSQLGKLDIAFLPVGGTFTINLHEAITCAEKLNPRLFVPMHFLHVSKEQAETALKNSEIKSKLPAIGEVTTI